VVAHGGDGGDAEFGDGGRREVWEAAV